MIGQHPFERHRARRKADLFLRLAQRRRCRRGIRRIDAAAWETHLAGVMGKRLGAFGEQDGGRVAGEDRDQHRRLTHPGRERGALAPPLVEGAKHARKPRFEFIEPHSQSPTLSSSSASPSGKKTPELHTPIIRRPKTSPGTARAASS